MAELVGLHAVRHYRVDSVYDCLARIHVRNLDCRREASEYGCFSKVGHTIWVLPTAKAGGFWPLWGLRGHARRHRYGLTSL